ncbi:hypothetical protein L873DRAFT_1895425, partial [Choiromyces venosus 120613-1]
REWQNNLPLGIYTLYNTPTPPAALPGSAEKDFALLGTHNTNGALCLIAAKSPSGRSISIFSALTIEGLDVNAHIAAIVGEIQHEREWKSFGGDARLALPLAKGLVAAQGKEVEVLQTIHGSAVTACTLSERAKKGVEGVLTPDHGIVQVLFPRDEDKWLLPVAQMLREFHAEANDREFSIEYCTRGVRSMVSRGDVWVYVIGDRPVAGCYLNCPTRCGKSIGHLHTILEHRRNGYAETLVGEVCRRLLIEQGLGYLTLFYRPGHPLERIYRRIGFGTGEGGGARKRLLRRWMLE